MNASSAQGDVVVSLVAAPDNVRATSSQGNVTVALPRGPVAYRVITSFDQGNVFDSTVHTDSTGRRLVTATSDQGDVSVAYGG